MAGKIMNADIQSVSELTAKGATAAELPNDDKVYVTALSINKTLKQAIVDGDIGGGGSTSPTIQIFTAGSGTYTTPVGCSYIIVKMVGGGGGGGGTGAGASNGSAGGDSTFGTSLLFAGGGLGGESSLSSFPAGGDNGSCVINSPAIQIINVQGEYGDNGLNTNGIGFRGVGGRGGNSFFGGSGRGTQNADGQNASGFGSGGGGAGNSATGTTGGAGGGGAGFCEAIIDSPSASYLYAVGAGGNGGNGPAVNDGGAGRNGRIIVLEFY